MKRLFIFGGLLFGLLASAGCVQRVGDLSVASTHLAKLDGVNLNEAPTTRHVTGESKKFILLFFPLGIPHLEDAVEDALNKGNGDLMTDITVHRTGWWFLVGETGWRVTGDVVNTRHVGDAG